ncbi:MAG: ADP-ribosylglycohydrolase family protein [Clostridia bacterium]|nr:ADP-ribosylglycohydrolase family protein [Clostridia bacterium]
MSISQTIVKLRNEKGMSQELVAEKISVSRQAIQKWEKGTSAPDFKNLVALSKLFGVTLDTLAFGSDARDVEVIESSKKVYPSINLLHHWERYSSALATEYRQSIEEGLDVEMYKSLFDSVGALQISEYKERLADVIFDIVLNAPLRPGYGYKEPDTLPEIRELRNTSLYVIDENAKCYDLKDRIRGAWYGRICGCLLGKTVEGIRTDELHPMLKASGNYPMHRYIRSGDITQEMHESYKFRFSGRCFGDTVDSMPVDDDTNYTVLYQLLIEERGRDFTPYDVARHWLAKQPKDSYCTAERVAFVNITNGYYPPESAIYKNPFREWIGAQIRGDYFGYINPGDPETAADMAWRDGCIAQVKNGTYGEMFVAAMIACAAVTEDIGDIIRGGLAQIPETSRLYERIAAVLEGFENGVGEESFFTDFHKRWNEFNAHDWCHTVSNAEIVAASLLYGGGDYGRSICMAVEQGFDTDCNGATVGSILGMRNGIGGIGSEWTAPINGMLNTTIFGVGKVRIDDLVNKTFEHMDGNNKHIL